MFLGPGDTGNSQQSLRGLELLAWGSRPQGCRGWELLGLQCPGSMDCRCEPGMQLSLLLWDWVNSPVLRRPCLAVERSLCCRELQGLWKWSEKQ